MYKILIVEDDETIARLLREHLEKWGYQARCAEDFKQVAKEFKEYAPHLVLMDIGLPFYNGFYWCTEIRKTSNVPILFLSSMSDNMNIVMAIQMGGDDFVTKPFDLNVLTVKIQALLRRTYAFQGSASVTFQSQKIELTKNDYKILQILMERAGTIVKREEIMQRLWESDEFIDDNTLTVNMTRLRKKLEELGVQEFIKTKKGIGYIIE